jgi:hypothetical protein
MKSIIMAGILIAVGSQFSFINTKDSIRDVVSRDDR